MLDRRVIVLAREIRGLYGRSCCLAEKYNAAQTAERRALTQACRAGPSPIDELNYFEDVFDRQQAVRHALADPRVRAQTFVLHAVFWIIAVSVVWRGLAVPGEFYYALGVTLLVAVGAAFVQQHAIFRGDAFRRRLREQLRARQVPICLECGYDLRGQSVPRCPECGRAAEGVVPGARRMEWPRTS
jgi:hypothetical protein